VRHSKQYRAAAATEFPGYKHQDKTCVRVPTTDTFRLFSISRTIRYLAFVTNGTGESFGKEQPLSRHLRLFLLLVIPALSWLRAQAPTYPALELMSPDTKKAVGLEKLTGQEKKALNDFVMDLLTEAYAKGQAACGAQNTATAPRERRTSPSYVTGGGHWIGSNADGKLITLEDGSIWQTAELDQIDTRLWLPVTDITVISDRSPVGEYRYILINKDDGEKAHAKYLGHE
jgi:hypothetical protein